MKLPVPILLSLALLTKPLLSHPLASSPNGLGTKTPHLLPGNSLTDLLITNLLAIRQCDTNPEATGCSGAGGGGGGVWLPNSDIHMRYTYEEKPGVSRAYQQ